MFACFNNAYKYSPEMFDLWMRLLRQIDGSVLWLSVGHPTARHNLQREAELRQVDPGRLIFSSYVAEPERHLARLGAADLFLDTLPLQCPRNRRRCAARGRSCRHMQRRHFCRPRRRQPADRRRPAGTDCRRSGSIMKNWRSGWRATKMRCARSEKNSRPAGTSQPLFDAAGYSTRLETLLASLSEPRRRGRFSAPHNFRSPPRHIRGAGTPVPDARPKVRQPPQPRECARGDVRIVRCR